MGPEAPLKSRSATNRWTLEPLLFLLPWTFAGTLALSFLLAYAGTDSAFAGSVAIFITIWLWLAICGRGSSMRRAPEGRDKALNYRAPSLRRKPGRGRVVVDISEEFIRGLKKKAVTLRKHIIRMTHNAQSGHPGGSMSACDIVAALYFQVLRVDPKKPQWPDRDRFVLSKGHACPVWYAALAERGFFPVDELMTFRKINSRLQGHPELGTTPGVENAAGAEGQGLSFSVGLSLAARMDHKAWRVYCILGDGEQDVGQTWEAAMAASKYGLDNLTAFIDRNGIQQEGRTEDIMPLEPLAEKWEAFNWHVLTIDGHDFRQILAAIDEAHRTKGRPTAVIARTVKGKGVSFMENKIKYHGAATSDDELKLALAELDAQEAAV